MVENISFSEFEDYLLVVVSDRVITVKRAEEILTAIGQKCSSLNYKKVLLDERTVDRREVSPPEILKLSTEMSNQGLSKVYLAFLCRSHLINKDSKLLTLFTFKNEYLIKHFSEKKKAVEWLKR